MTQWLDKQWASSSTRPSHHLSEKINEIFMDLAVEYDRVSQLMILQATGMEFVKNLLSMTLECFIDCQGYPAVSRRDPSRNQLIAASRSV